VQAKKVAAVDPAPLPPAPEAKENVEAPPPQPEPEKAEPPPEPKKPEPKPAEAPPPPPEPKPEPKPEPEPKKAEAPPPPPEPKPKPVDLPKPEKKAEKKPEKKPEKPKPKFDPSKIASLIDKRDPGMKPQEARELSNVTTAGVASGTASQLSLSMQSMIASMLQEQLYQCFNPPPGTVGRSDMVATVRFDVTEQGILVGQPELMTNSSDPMFAAFADAAMRAVYNCTQAGRPLRLPPEHYSFWKQPILDFRPPPG
jgi:colicin import membrane protein